MRSPLAMVLGSVAIMGCSRSSSSRAADPDPSSTPHLTASAPSAVATVVAPDSIGTLASPDASMVTDASAPPFPAPPERDATADATFDPSLPINAAVRLACHGRRPCRLQARASAGRDDRGRALEVVTLDLVHFDEAGHPEYIEDAGALDEEWSVAYPQEPAITPEIHLLSAEGWGPFGPQGADELTLAPNRVTIVAGMVGGVGGGMALTRVLRLSPLSLRAEEEAVFGRTEPYASRTRWSWDDFAGDESWFHYRCVPDGGRDPGNWEEYGVDGGPPSGGEAYLSIPSVEVDDPTFATEGWRTTDLGLCAALIDASGSHGFVLRGAPGRATDAAMRVLAIDADDFIVELRDDVWTRPKDAGGIQDEVEVWTATERPDLCPHDSSSVQWLVSADDGHVTPAFGNPAAAAVTVARVKDGDVVRMRIHLSAPHASMAFAYRDSDDGVSSKRVLATSRLRPGDPTSLGTLKVIPRKDATCHVVSVGDAASARRKLEPHETRGAPTPHVW